MHTMQYTVACRLSASAGRVIAILLTKLSRCIYVDVNILRDMSTGQMQQSKLADLITRQTILLKHVLQREYIVAGFINNGIF